jgi:hypothetical protein
MTRSLFQKYTSLVAAKQLRLNTECHADKNEEKPREEAETNKTSSGFLAPDT